MLKRLRYFLDRNKEIREENAKLIRALDNIMGCDSNNAGQKVQKIKSLNWGRRRSEMKRIDCENRVIYSSLLATRSTFNKSEMQKRNQTIKAYKLNLSRNTS